MKRKSPMRRIVAFLIQLAILYAGICIVVSLVTGNSISFALWNAGGVNRLQTVENFVVAGIDQDGYRTDLILFCQYDMTDNSLTAMQIPRDTKVDNKRNDKKINSAYGSPKKTEAMFDELESIVGIRPDKYVIVSFKGFRDLIDAIGGVEVDVPMRMYYTDPYQNLTIDLYPGEQLLDGRRAEMFMRFRKNLDGSGYPDGDIGRNAAQRDFYKAVMNKLLSGKTVLKAPQLLSIVNKNVNTNFSGEDIIKYIGKIPKFSMDNINIISLPGEGKYDKNGVSYFYYDKEQTKTLVQQNFKTGRSDYKKTVNVNPSKNKFIRVKLVNACSIKAEQADVLKLVSDNLAEHGFNVIETETAKRIRDKSELINHSAKLAASEIKKVYENIEINEEIQRLEKDENKKSADVTLIIGNDFVF